MLQGRSRPGGTPALARARGRRALLSQYAVHRDPFGVGLSAAPEPARLASARRSDGGGRRPAAGR